MNDAELLETIEMAKAKLKETQEELDYIVNAETVWKLRAEINSQKFTIQLCEQMLKPYETF